MCPPDINSIPTHPRHCTARSQRWRLPPCLPLPTALGPCFRQVPLFFKPGVPNLQHLKLDDLRWSWCNNNRNEVHSKYNALESSWKLAHSPPHLRKNCLPWNWSLVPKRSGTVALNHWCLCCCWFQTVSLVLKLGNYRLIFMWSTAQYGHINLLFDTNLSACKINFWHSLFDIKIWYCDSGQLWNSWPDIVTWILDLTNNSFLISGVCLLWCWILNLAIEFSLEL